jgi:hypothetical protein
MSSELPFLGSRASVAGFQSGGEKCRYLECAVISNVPFFQKFTVFRS